MERWPEVIWMQTIVEHTSALWRMKKLALKYLAENYKLQLPVGTYLTGN